LRIVRLDSRKLGRWPMREWRLRLI